MESHHANLAKSGLLFTLVILIAFGVFALNAAVGNAQVLSQTTNAAVQTSLPDAQVGDQLLIAVSTSNFVKVNQTDVNVAALSFSFDSQVLRLQDITTTQDIALGESIDNVVGSAKIDVASAGQPFIADEELATLNFEILDNTPRSTVVSIVPETTQFGVPNNFDSVASELDFTVQIGAPAVVTSSTTTSSTTTSNDQSSTSSSTTSASTTTQGSGGVPDWNVNIIGYGGPGAVPTPGDFDGDGQVDLAVKTYQGEWLVDYAANGYGDWDALFEGYGGRDHVPVVEDYDGDGRSDLSVKTFGGKWLIDYAQNGFNGWDVEVPEVEDNGFSTQPE